MANAPADEPHDLDRFVAAQEGVFATALAELTSGAKRTHWIWFVFPQIDGLGSSPTARKYAIRSLAEARAYAAHPVLGPRLAEAVRAALGSGTRDAHALFGSPDDMKFLTSMTLFAIADPARTDYREAINAFFDGEPDPRTVESQIIKAHI